MMYIWNHGRFAWPFVAFIAYCVAWLVAGDYLWRIVKMSTVRLIGYCSALWLLGLAVLAGATVYWS
jgi:hypothetical protein